MNAYTFYKVGDTFHNDNGEDYLIIALSEEQDKAILCKTTNDGTPFYIGAKGLSKHCWAFGHYFMFDLMNACRWFYEDGEAEGMTIEDFIQKMENYQYNDFYLHDLDTSSAFRFRGNEIPNGFLRAHLDSFDITDNSTTEDEAEFIKPVIITFFHSEKDGIDIEMMTAAYSDRFL